MLTPLRRGFAGAVCGRIDSRFAAYAVESARIRADYEARLGGLQADYDFLRSEFDRLAPQLAALEYRVERLANAPLDAGAEKATTTAALEHERARLRVELASHYEERLRRLEEAAQA